MTRTLLGMVLVASLLVGFPGSASARSFTHTDPAGDVWSRESQGSAPAQPSPLSTDSDVRQVTVQHRPRLVVVSMTVRTMDAQGGPGTDQAHFEFITRGHKTVVMDLTSDNSLIIRRLRYKNGDPFLEWHRCPSARSTSDKASGRRTIVFPRKCVYSPRRLRVRAWALNIAGSRGEIAYSDDAYGPYAPNDGVHRPGTSPWLRRG
jgi:hypothetical protein